jgi:colanic acid biosynthesis glycosyl transferase WcaI
VSLKRLFFVNRVYWPNEAATAQLLHDVATALAREGVTVTVITARVTDRPARETIDGVTVCRVYPSSSRHPRLITRAGRDARFLASAFAAVRHEARPGDAVIAMTDPPFLGLAAAAAARSRGAEVWHWCQDIYPEVAMAVTESPLVRAGLWMLTPLRNWSWRVSQGCVVLGADMAALVARHGVPKTRIHVAPNWAVGGGPAADDASAGFRRSTGINGKFVVMYSGNLGRVHTFESLLEAARRLRHRDDVVFLLVGEGPQYSRVADAARRGSLGNVRFLPPQPRAALAASLSAADLQVVTLRPGCESVVWPSKFYGAVAAERPLLYIGPAAAEIAEQVANHGLGGAFQPDEDEAIASFIVRLADDAGARATVRERVRTFARTLPGLPEAVAHWKQVATSKR